MTGELDRKEFVAGYLAEAEEHLRTANAELLGLEAALRKNEASPRAVRELFRALHTLKGLSAMIGVEPVVEIAHEMEALLRVADRTGQRLTLSAVELMLKGIAAIEHRVACFGAGKPVPAAAPALISALATLQTGPSVVSKSVGRIALPAELLAKMTHSEQLQLSQGVTASRRALRVDYIPSPERTAQGISITQVRERLAQVAEIVKVMPVSLQRTELAPGALAFVLILLTTASAEAVAEAAYVNPATILNIEVEVEPPEAEESWVPDELDGGDSDVPLRTSSIRVEVARLDDAMEKLSELVVTRFRLARAVSALRERGVEVRELSAIVDENARQLRDLRGCITRTRLVPVRELLERVPLIVRGMSRSTGKLVRLEIEAGSAELDKSVGERIFPAIVHLVRNAIDHAIELPEERKALNKPEQGLIRVSCFEHSNSELEVRVTDDGRGIDGARIAQKAKRPLPRSNRELLDLVTLPGLSSLDQATSNSGRGMGMDIVRRIAVETLRGSLSLETEAEKGTTFILRIPLSISIVDSFSFACGGETFVVPVSMIEEIIEVEASNIIEPPAPELGPATVKLIERRGRAVPLLPLAQLFRLKQASITTKALVIRRGDESFAFGVDRMFGQQEIVVRPLEDPLVKVIGIAGATDLGDGKPTLVLDLVSLAAFAGQAREVTV